MPSRGSPEHKWWSRELPSPAGGNPEARIRGLGDPAWCPQQKEAMPCSLPQDALGALYHKSLRRSTLCEWWHWFQRAVDLEPCSSQLLPNPAIHFGFVLGSHPIGLLHCPPFTPRAGEPSHQIAVTWMALPRPLALLRLELCWDQAEHLLWASPGARGSKPAACHKFLYYLDGNFNPPGTGIIC